MLTEELFDIKNQITTKLYKNLQLYLDIFMTQVRERDPIEGDSERFN